MAKTAGPEKQIQNEIILWLLSQPFILKVWQHSQLSIRGRTFSSRYRPLGVSDVIGFIRPRASEKIARGLAIEVKTKNGILSGPQKLFIDDCSAGGALAFIARSLEDVINQFKKEGYLK